LAEVVNGGGDNWGEEEKVNIELEFV